MNRGRSRGCWWMISCIPCRGCRCCCSSLRRPPGGRIRGTACRFSYRCIGDRDGSVLVFPCGLLKLPFQPFSCGGRLGSSLALGANSGSCGWESLRSFIDAPRNVFLALQLLLRLLVQPEAALEDVSMRGVQWSSWDRWVACWGCDREPSQPQSQERSNLSSSSSSGPWGTILKVLWAGSCLLWSSQWWTNS